MICAPSAPLCIFLRLNIAIRGSKSLSRIRFCNIYTVLIAGCQICTNLSAKRSNTVNSAPKHSRYSVLFSVFHSIFERQFRALRTAFCFCGYTGYIKQRFSCTVIERSYNYRTLARYPSVCNRCFIAVYAQAV